MGVTQLCTWWDVGQLLHMATVVTPVRYSGGDHWQPPPYTTTQHTVGVRRISCSWQPPTIPYRTPFSLSVSQCTRQRNPEFINNTNNRREPCATTVKKISRWNGGMNCMPLCNRGAFLVTAIQYRPLQQYARRRLFSVHRPTAALHAAVAIGHPPTAALQEACPPRPPLSLLILLLDVSVIGTAAPLTVWMPKMRRLVLMSGSGNSIFRSIRPGRMRAGSSDSILFVAMITWPSKKTTTKKKNKNAHATFTFSIDECIIHMYGANSVSDAMMTWRSNQANHVNVSIDGGTARGKEYFRCHH